MKANYTVEIIMFQNRNSMGLRYSSYTQILTNEHENSIDIKICILKIKNSSYF